MRNYWAVAAMFLLCQPSAVLGANVAKTAHISPSVLAANRAESLAQRLAQKGQFSGVLLIAKSGNPILLSTYGLANRDKGTRVAPQTSFAIASAGKMFTAVAVLQLVASGRLSLDDTVGKIIPDYPNRDIATKVTVRQLLTHTGGTGDIFGKDWAANRQSLRTLDDYMKKFGSRAPEFEPGAQQSYSNYGFIILGLMIERLTGQSYYDYVRDQIFVPAGMKHSSYPVGDGAAPGIAIGYTALNSDGHPTGILRPNFDTLPWRGTSAGGGVSSAPDLLRFVNALQSGKLLPPALFARATSQQVPGEGFGFFLTGDGPSFNWAHGGGALGMNADIRVYPNIGFTIICLANRDPQVAGRIVNHFEAALIDPEGRTPLFLRGTMNGWSTKSPLRRISRNLYQADISLPAGSYEFKVASADWKTVDLGDGALEPSNINERSKTAPLAARGQNLRLSISRAGVYRFALVGHARGEPEVQVARQGN